MIASPYSLIAFSISPTAIASSACLASASGLTYFLPMDNSRPKRTESLKRWVSQHIHQQLLLLYSAVIPFDKFVPLQDNIIMHRQIVSNTAVFLRRPEPNIFTTCATGRFDRILDSYGTTCIKALLVDYKTSIHDRGRRGNDYVCADAFKWAIHNHISQQAAFKEKWSKFGCLPFVLLLKK